MEVIVNTIGGFVKRSPGRAYARFHELPPSCRVTLKGFALRHATGKDRANNQSVIWKLPPDSMAPKLQV
jgi:hypothetical protein